MRSKNKVPLQPPQPAPQTSQFRAAYDRQAHARAALSKDSLISPRIDIGGAVTTCLGAMPEIRSYRPQIVKWLPGFDLSEFDKLEEHAQATGHAHSVCIASSDTEDPVPELAEEVNRTRASFLSDLDALANHGLIDRSRLAEIKAGTSYRDSAYAVLAGAALVRELWPRIQGRTALTEEEVARAEVIAERLITALGLREKATVNAADAAAERVRAYTLFVNAYDQARRAITYLRWNDGDLNDIAPSLFAARMNGPKGKTEKTESKSDVPVTPAIPVTPIVAPPAAPRGGAIGMPGSDPLSPR